MKTEIPINKQVEDNTSQQLQPIIQKIPLPQKTFLIGLIGKPESGKSFYIQSIVKEYGNLFDFVFFVTPSPLQGFDLNQDNAMKIYDPAKIIQKLEEISVMLQKKTGRILLILDDVVSSIKNQERNSTQINLFFNRRKIIENFEISIIISTQRYTLIPQNIRSILTQLVVFKVQPMEFQKIKAEQISNTNSIINKIYEKTQTTEFAKMVFDLNDSQIYYNNQNILDYNFKI